MSYVPMQAKLIGETLEMGFDFQSQMIFGETLDPPLIASVVVTLFSGIDPSPMSILTGAVTVSGTTVKTKVTAGRAGVIYILTFHAAGSSGAVYRGTRELAILSNDGSFVPSSVPALTGDLPDGVVGAAYSHNLTISGGYMPYTPATPTGSAPEWMGFTVVDATLVCAGTSSSDALASYSFNARIQDAALTFASSAQVVNLTRTTVAGDLGNMVPGESPTFSYTASLGTSPYTFTIVGGALPTGLSLNSNGSIVGSTTTPGSFSWTVRGTDVNNIIDDHADSASVQSWEWIGSTFTGPGKDIVPSIDGLTWNTSLGWDITNWNDGFLVRRTTDGAIAVYNPVSFGFKFGISFDNGATFSMFNTVGMNATGHVVGWSGGFWQCSSTGGATRITDGGVQSSVASSTGFNTMCIANNRMIGFKSSRIWHADVTGDNWVDTLAMPITTLAVPQRAKANGNTVVLVGYVDLGATLTLHAVWSGDNGSSFNDTTPITMSDPGVSVLPLVWYDAVKNLWAAALYNRVAFGQDPASLTEAGFTFPSVISDIYSDGEKFLFSCENNIVVTSDFITFTTVYTGFVKSAVAFPPD